MSRLAGLWLALPPDSEKVLGPNLQTWPGLAPVKDKRVKMDGHFTDTLCWDF